MITADTGPSTPCPVALLGLEIQRLIRQREIYEMRCQELFDGATTRLMELEDAVLKMHPHSPRGAFIAMLMSIGLIDPLGCAESDEAIQRLVLVQRALSHAAMALAEPGDELLLDYYLVSATVLEARAA